MCDNANGNPFAGLFSTPVEAVTFSSPNACQDERIDFPKNDAPTESSIPEGSGRTSNDTDRTDPVDDLLRDVFGLTLKSDNEHRSKKYLVFVDADSVENAIFERLILTDVKSRLIPASASKEWTCDSHTLEQDAIPYLFESFCRLRMRRNQNERLEETRNNMEKLTLRNVGTALQAPDFFPGQKVHAQFASLFEDGAFKSAELSSFLSGVIEELGTSDLEPDDETVASAFSPVLDIIQKEAADRNILTFRQYWFDVLQKFASIESLAKLIVRHSSPKSNNGRAYADTLFGALLSLSCLPKTNDGQFEFFDKPLQPARSTIEGNIWAALEVLSESLHLVFHTLLKCSPEVRHLTLKWLGECLEANESRGKLWNSQSEMFAASLAASDGFMLNLGTVMLRLCQPFCGKLNESKILKIDPTYCAVEAKDEDESRKRGLHIRGMSTETCLVPTAEGETRPVAESFGFVTECFFLTHRTLDIGYRVVVEKLLRTNQDLARVQRLYNDVQANDAGGSSALQVVTTRMENEMNKYLSLRTSLLVPGMLDVLSKFHATTASWLIQVNLDVDDESTTESSLPRTNYAPRKFTTVTFPLPERVPDSVKCIPEFVVENTVGLVCFLRRLSPNPFEEGGPAFLNPLLTKIIALMGSPQRLYNPHLRARLAEGLGALLPLNDDSAPQAQISLGTIFREKLFVEHPHRSQIIPNLLQVFVSIEMTGHSVQFEQKFNYRRPMYTVMDYLWKIDQHRNIFKNLAEEAEENMEAVQPPLFLRFINLLMNDAVFLLDEALTNMAQLKQMLQARESGEWNKLPPQERDQQMSSLQHIGMIARFDNILGCKTINMLKMLTTEIKSIFCHPTMVDRIASMLNYLLLQLVGPNKRNLKVKDQNEYEFNPANLVLNICEIYINLSQNENFTLAVSQDGRSYSSELFELADNVLVRIGGVGILSDLDTFAKRVKEAGDVKREEDEILNNAPDEFLDPIMSTLMTDPVLLPSSNINVDRPTIARHLLSDQTDPFNRSPLTMDMVKSNTELRSRIEDWIKQKRAEKSSSSELEQG